MQIDVDDYQSQIAQMRFGKRVGTSIYFHEECTADLPPGVAEVANGAKSLAQRSCFEFNVYKLDTRTPLISLLNYPTFFEEAFPTLTRKTNANSQMALLATELLFKILDQEDQVQESVVLEPELFVGSSTGPCP